MPVTYSVEPGEGIVYMSVDGEAPFEEWRGVLLEVFADPAYRPGFNFLSDRTRATDCPDSNYVQRCLDFLLEHRREMGSYRWAMVSRQPAVYGMQRMFSILGESNGVRAEVFKDFEQARGWLLGRP